MGIVFLFLICRDTSLFIKADAVPAEAKQIEHNIFHVFMLKVFQSIFWNMQSNNTVSGKKKSLTTD